MIRLEIRPPKAHIVVTYDHIWNFSMSTVSLKDAKASLSNYVDDAIKGEFITITRHGKPVAAIVPLAAAEIARKSMTKDRPSFLAYLRTFPGGSFERNMTPSRDIDL
jgi:prevent-host-death family protein